MDATQESSPWSERNDEELVELSKANPDAFGGLVSRYQNKLFRYVKRVSWVSDEDSEDIVQDAFIKLYKNINAFDETLKFSTWMYRITHNTMIDFLRRKKSRPSTLWLPSEDALLLLQSDTDIQAEMETKEKQELLQKSLNELPLVYKEVMVLRFLEEKTYEEIMDIVQKPKGTVAAIINRGKKMVLEKIRGYELLEH